METVLYQEQMSPKGACSLFSKKSQAAHSVSSQPSVSTGREEFSSRDLEYPRSFTNSSTPGEQRRIHGKGGLRITRPRFAPRYSSRDTIRTESTSNQQPPRSGTSLGDSECVSKPPLDEAPDFDAPCAPGWETPDSHEASAVSLIWYGLYASIT
ncbi:hypothetical protein R1flu_008418 [Riccia fluitans]|uniref:Uncharacterized protein n=1 Tax=Riccia fluitans TaxID=41844 RepID=A0ABD1YBN3_9MARC